MPHLLLTFHFLSLCCRVNHIASIHFFLLIINKAIIFKMAEAAFANLLENKEMSEKFDLHKIERDCDGTEKAMKVEKDSVA